MRRGEIVGDKGVPCEQVDFDLNCIRLSSSQAKTKTPRIIYMRDDFLRVMKRAKELRDRHYIDFVNLTCYKRKGTDSPSDATIPHAHTASFQT